MVWLIVSISLQLLCAVHCLRNRRNAGWLLGILLFSLLGCAAYFIVEIVPDLRNDRRYRRAAANIADRVDPDRLVRAARERLEVSDTVATRLAMGDALAAKGQFSEALDHFMMAHGKSKLVDPAVNMRLANAYLELGQTDSALASIDALPEGGTQNDSDKRAMLRGRLLEQSGDVHAALAIYEEIMDRLVGEEGRCRAANVRLGIGDRAGAKALLTEVERRMRHLPRDTIADDANMYRWAMTTLADLRN